MQNFFTEMHDIRSKSQNGNTSDSPDEMCLDGALRLLLLLSLGGVASKREKFSNVVSFHGVILVVIDGQQLFFFDREHTNGSRETGSQCYCLTSFLSR